LEKGLLPKGKWDNAMGLDKNQRYVIFDGPKQHGGLGSCYFSEDGTSTEHRHQAAKFFTITEAKYFATRKTIPLGQEQFGCGGIWVLIRRNLKL
jgi:hypothetical protein